MSFAYLLLISILSLFLTFFLGYLGLRSLSQWSIDRCLALAGAWGIALQSALAFLNFLLGFSGKTFLVVATLGLFLLFFALLLRKPKREEQRGHYQWIYLPLLLWLALLGMQLFVLLYSGAGYYGDWWMHYDIARIYLGTQKLDTVYFEIYNVTSRTPLFNLFSSYYLGLFEESFSIYQILSILPGIALVTLIPLFLRPSLIPLAFSLVAFSPYFSNMISYPWPKILATVYILVSFYFYLDIRHNCRSRLYSVSGLACGLGWGLALLSHPSAILYVIALIIDNLWVNRHNLPLVARQTGFALIVAIAICLPWYLWGISQFGLASLFSTAARTTGTATAFGRIIDAINNSIATIFPLELIEAVTKRIVHGPGSGGEYHVLRYQLWNSWFRLYYGIFSGALTLTLLAVLVVGFWQRVSGKVRSHPLFPPSFLVSVFAIGFWGGCFLQPGYHRGGVVGESMTPLVVLLFFFAVEYLATLPVRVKQGAFLAVVLEFFLSRGIHLLFLGTEGSVVWDGNADLKGKYALVFARDIIGNSSGLWITTIPLILFLVIGWKSLLIDRKVISTH
jgi:hypothetical protein